MSDAGPATLLITDSSVSEILNRRPSRRAGRPGPHYPSRCNPIAAAAGAAVWVRDWKINGYPAEVAAQLHAPSVHESGVWRMLPSGIWVGLQMA